MKFKVGDKVKFLNERGGGVVSKIVSPGMVNVAIEEGFDIPVMISNIIKIETEVPPDSPKHMFSEDFKVNITQAPEETGNINIRHSVPLSRIPGQGEVPEGIFIAFIPHDQKWLITGLMDVYLVNHTPFQLQFTIYLEDDQAGYKRTGFGAMTEESMYLVETLEREQLVKWELGVVQVLYHREKSHKILTPGNSSFRVKATKFFQEGHYRSSAILNGKSILISLLPLSAQLTLVQAEIENKTSLPDQNLSQATLAEPEHIIDKHKTSPREAVVDLHIGELVENYDQLENAEILRIQVNYFTRCLENAIVNNLSKVTFIHGVGTGVLKTAIKQILKDYPNVELRDASMAQFGYGAMDVIIGK